MVRKLDIHEKMYDFEFQNKCTFRNMLQTNGIFLLIGEQQNTYLALKGKGTCCIISAKNLKSSMLHIKYKESSTVESVTKISWNKSKNSNMLNYNIHTHYTTWWINFKLSYTSIYIYIL